MRPEHCCYIGLGSNMGDVRANIAAAIGLLGEVDGIAVSRVAPLYRTAPVGYTQQDYFANTVVEIITSLSADELLCQLQGIENQLGRVRQIRWGPRTVDLDLLLYDDQVINEPHLIVPHPRMNQRAFVMVPLADLNPDLIIDDLKAVDLACKLADEQQIEAWPPESERND